MKKYFQGKVILITGGGAGLGRALSLEMARCGARLHVLDLSTDKAIDTKEWIIREGGSVRFHKADVTDFAHFSQLIDAIYESDGRIDVLINNAGINITGEARDMQKEHWYNPLNINLMGTVNAISLVYPRMVGQGSGQIVNIASMAGLAPIPLISPYVASKFAVVGLTRSLRLEAEGLGIKINLVCPGRLNTSILESSDILKVNREEFMKQIPFAPMPLPAAVKKIIRGMIANKPMIIFPGYVRWLWWADRYLPFVLKPFYRYSLIKYRKLRTENFV